MKIRNKILFYFSSTVIALTGITFLVIYFFFSANREEEFQQRQQQKISTTLYFLSEIKKTDEDLIEAIDQLTIHDLFDEKLLLFNDKKELIYSSIDDTPVPISKNMLDGLNSENRWIETKEGLYDVVGTYIEEDGDTYFGISKAYDTFGYNKLYFLRNVLITSFIAITIAVLLISFYLAKFISKPLTDLADLLGSYNLDGNQIPESIETTTYEIAYLNQKFNKLLERTHAAFAFQKHSIQHISHQLKTPISVLISELERIKEIDNSKVLKSELDDQIIKTKSLADIINVMLEISKVESGQAIKKNNVRIDEVIFDCVEELNIIYPNFYFEVSYTPEEPDINRLILNVNEMLFKQAVQNLLSNCVTYSSNARAEIEINCTLNNELKLRISNTGKPVSVEEQEHLFNLFFRGENSRDRTGFGLGLVLTKEIMALHAGHISYANPGADRNVFELRFPLS